MDGPTSHAPVRRGSNALRGGVGGRQSKDLISPPHKRAEGRAPVWGSELTSKDATQQGDSAEMAPTLNAKLWDLVVASYGFLA